MNNLSPKFFVSEWLNKIVLSKNKNKQNDFVKKIMAVKTKR